MAPEAAASKSFSIREYAAGMRSVNFDKCWPFGGIDKEVETKFLPQISVRKYRFWSDEIRSNEIMEGKSKTRKQKSPKKRSIVEIFAVSPKMKNVRKSKSSRNGKTVKKKIQVEICSAKKAKRSKPTSSVDITQSLKNSLRIGRKNPNEDKKKPLYMKNLAKSRKLKLLQSTKMIAEKQRKRGKGSQVHTILRNCTTNRSKKLSAWESDTCANNCTHIDIPQLRSLCKKFSDVLAASSALENTHRTNNRSENDDTNVATNTMERSGIEVLSEKEQLSESHCDIVPKIFEKQQNAYPNAMENTSSCTGNQVKESTLKTIDMCSCMDNQVRGPTLNTIDLQYSQSVPRNLMANSSSRNEVDLNTRPFPCLEPVKDSSWKTAEFYPLQSSLQNQKENFVGLPLNSQGELIDFQSSSKFGFREMGPIHSSSRNVVDFRNATKGKFPRMNLNQNEQLNCFQDPYSSIRRPVISSERFGGQNIETCQGSMQSNHTRNYIDSVNFQNDIHRAPHSSNEQTMRLMGTDVIVGSENYRGRQSYNNGKSLIDKEVIFNRQHWRPQQTYQASSNYPRFDSSSNLYPKPIFSSFQNQPQWISRNDPSTNVNNNRIRQQFPINYQQMMLNSTHCKHSLGISSNAASNVYHPFISQENKSSQNLTHWLLNTNMQKKNKENSCSCFPNSFASQQNSSVPQTNNFPFRLPHFSSNVSFPVCTPTFSHTAPRTVYRDGSNCNFTYLKSLDSSSNARKRPAVTNIDFVRPKKVQLPAIPGNTSAGKNEAGAEISRVDDNECRIPFSKNAIVAENSGVDKEFRLPSSSSSQKIDIGKSCGPVKLRAGAKHVLKPGFDINEDFPVPTHSTLTYDSAPDFSVRRSEIYRF